MKYKKGFPIALISLMLISCSQGGTQEVILNPGDNLSYLNNIELDYDNIFFDDFADGVSSSDWYIGNQAWGGGNGGVIPENVSYTDDGILVLTGNGRYYLDGDVKGVGDVKDGRYTGAALISKFMVGPGRYEIKMKVHPRLGACTAFWTFAYDHSDSSNHEIDIELPGGVHKGVVSFENLLNTNYQTESNMITQDVKVSTLLGEEEVFINDGKWHTYGFDWYTNPERVVYHLDGKVTATTEIFVPYKTGRLWVGDWFPVSSSFVGAADFETDHMLVDYISYTPFKNQPVTEFVPDVNGVATINQYPQSPVSLRKINKIANGDFEFTKEQLLNSGWTFKKYLNMGDKKPIDEVVYVEENKGVSLSNALMVKDSGVAMQNLTAIYNGFEHDFSFMAKGKGKVLINYYATMTTEILEQLSLDVDSEDFKEYKIDLKAPANTQQMTFMFQTSMGNQMYVDDISLYTK